MQEAIPQSSDSLAPLAAEKSVLELYLFAILCYLHMLPHVHPLPSPRVVEEIVRVAVTEQPNDASKVICKLYVSLMQHEFCF